MLSVCWSTSRSGSKVHWRFFTFSNTKSCILKISIIVIRSEKTFFYTFLYYFYWRVKVRVKEGETEKGVPSADLVFIWLQWPEPNQSNTRSQKLSLGLPDGCRGPRT